MLPYKRATFIVLGLFMSIAPLSCDTKHGERVEDSHIEVTGLEGALDSYALMLSEMAKILSMDGSSEVVEAELETYFVKNNDLIEQKYLTLAQHFSALSEEEVMKSHAAFIERKEVKAFLDAQDRYRSQHGDESADRVDMRLSELYILSE